MNLTDRQLRERCQCQHERARHYGYTGQDGMCDRCYCPHFNPRTQEAQEAELRLLNTMLEMAYKHMPFTQKPPRLCECLHLHEQHHKGRMYGLETFGCEECGCPEYSGN